MTQKWSIEVIPLVLDESDLTVTCSKCRSISISLNCITNWIALTSPITLQDSSFMVASPQLNKTAAFKICIQDCFINVNDPFLLMEMCKVKCHSCNTQLGIFLKTVNCEHLEELEGRILLNIDNLCDIQTYQGLMTMIKQNARMQIHKVGKDLSNIPDSIFQDRQNSVIQNIIFFSQRIRELQYRVSVLNAIEEVYEKIFQLQEQCQTAQQTEIQSTDSFKKQFDYPQDPR